MLDNSTVIYNTVSMDAINGVARDCMSAIRGYFTRSPDAKTFAICFVAVWSAMHIMLILKVIFAFAAVVALYMLCAKFFPSLPGIGALRP
jgi:hypothetical protein